MQVPMIADVYSAIRTQAAGDICSFCYKLGVTTMLTRERCWTFHCFFMKGTEIMRALSFVGAPVW